MKMRLRKMYKKKNGDDGINFQWGDRYIAAEELIEGVGGKYWKWNEDGRITIFSPPELRFRTICSCIINDCCKPTNKFKVIGTYKIRFASDIEAKYFFKEFSDDFWNLREVTPTLQNRVIDFDISEEVLTDTYFPAVVD